MAQTKAQLLGPVVGDVVMDVSTLSLDAEGNKVGIGHSEPDLTLHVSGVNGLPSSSGSTPTGHLTIRNKAGSTHGMFMGVSDASPWSSWIQAQDASNNATNYPLLLNPNGGNVGIGTNNPQRKLEVFDGDIYLNSTDKKIFLTSDYDQYITANAASNYLVIGTANQERLRIDSLGSAQFQGQNAPAGLDTRISQYGSLLVATTGELISNARCSIDSGNGTITTTGNGLFAVNASTYQTGINLHTSSNLSTLTVYSNNSSTHRSLVIYDNAQSSNAAKYRAAIYANGSASFAGAVDVGGDANNGTAEGIELQNSGFIQISRGSGVSALWAGYTQGSSVQTSRINNDGGASFKDGSTRFAGINGGSAVFYGGDSTTTSQSNAKFRLNTDGSVSFAAGAVAISGSGAISSNRTSGTNDCWNGKLNGSVTSTINADGSATFAGAVESTSFFKVTNTGIAYLQPNTVTAFQAYESSGPVKINLNNNGSATFASNALNIGTTGNVTIANPTTSARLNVLGDINGNYTGWKEKGVASGSMSAASIASKTPTINDFTYPNNSNGMLIWSTSKIGFAAGSESPQYGTGVQMLFDNGGLILGGNRAFDRTTVSSTATNWAVRLRTSGIGEFKSTLYANPFQLTSSNSWIKSGYGAITNSTVQSLNNLMTAQNIRGYIEGIDGGSTNNNFYSVVTHGGMGYAGTEYCYGGITKFYNGTATDMGSATSANTAFTPKERFRVESSGVTVGAAYKFSNTGPTGTSLPNPYLIGNLSSSTIPSYPHIPGIYYIRADSPCDNTWRNILTSINDSTFVFEGISGDASSKRSYKIIGAPTSPAYGVNRMSEHYNTGAWNTGDIEFRLDGSGGNWNLQVKTASYYNSSNVATVRFHLFCYY